MIMDVQRAQMEEQRNWRKADTYLALGNMFFPGSPFPNQCHLCELNL